jgi:LCP family protein required for cell wall assembly
MPAWSQWRQWLRTALLLAVGILGVVLLLSYLQVRGLAEQAIVREVRPGHIAIPPAAPFTMLLIGVDEREGFPEEGVRGDTLIVVRVDPPARRVAMLSIPRDSLATLPVFGPNKINAAYSLAYNDPEGLYGAGVTGREAGMAHAAETVSGLIGLRIDYTVQVNFDGFARIVDALGGITIDVPRPIVDEEYPTEDFGVQRIEFAAGVQRMDGERALIYARTRHADSDFGRSERQQQVIRAIIDELRSRGPIGQALLLPALRQSLGSTIATTLPFDRIDALFGFGLLASGLDPQAIVRLQISPETAAFREQPGGIIAWDSADVQALAQGLLAAPSAEAEAAHVQVLNGTQVAGLAGRVSTDLEGRGFLIIPASDAPFESERTLIYDRAGKPYTTRQLAELLNAEQRSGTPEGYLGDADVVVILGSDYGN